MSIFGANPRAYGSHGLVGKPLDSAAEISRLLNQHTNHWLNLGECRSRPRARACWEWKTAAAPSPPRRRPSSATQV